MNFLKPTKNLLWSIYSSLKRFPFTMVMSVFTAAILIAISEIEAQSSSTLLDTLERITMVIALGIPLSLCIKLVLERNPALKNIYQLLSYVFGSALLIAYYFSLPADLGIIPVSQYVGLNIALYLAFLYIPYFFKRDKFEMYIIKVVTRFLVTFIYSLVLYLGLSAILVTINKLLSVPVPSQAYYYTFLIIAGVFVPGFLLAGVPGYEDTMDDDKYPGIFKILLLYIVMPIITVYLAILYIYFIKIIITHQWPQGLVSNLVLWYSVICAAVIFLISPLKNNQWAKRFVLWFPKLITPILVMMFVSIGIRINAYGATENRYYVVLLGLWVFAVMLYISIAGVKRNIIIPISFSLIALISLFGPLSSFSISAYSQNKRLDEILVRNQMIVNGKIIKAPSSVSDNDKKQISQILQYFDSKSGLSDVKYLPKNFALMDMENVFGFSYRMTVHTKTTIISHTVFKMTGVQVDIKNYD